MSDDGPYEHERQIAIAVAKAAAVVISDIAREGFEVESKDGDEPVTRADRAASDIILADLAAAFPDDILISEEAPIARERCTARRVWYVDPIDGTKDFIKGADGYSVMIGLCVDGRPTVGVVLQPSSGQIYSGIPGHGAWLQDHAGEHGMTVSNVATLADARFVASKQNRTPVIDKVKGALGLKSETNIGSVGLKLALIAAGERDLYVNPLPRCKVWDTCAPEAILLAAGGRVTDMYGEALDYRSETLTRPRGLVASNGQFHEAACEKLGQLFGGTNA